MKRFIFLFFVAIMTPAFSQIYDRIDNYYEGLALVKGYTKVNGFSAKYGYVNEYNQLVIPLKYESAESFRNGTAVVGMEIKYGIIDKHDKVILPIKYDGIARLFFAGDKNVFMIRNTNRVGCVNNEGKWIIPCEYKYYSRVGIDEGHGTNSKHHFIAMANDIFSDRKWYLFTPDGTPVLPERGYLTQKFLGLSVRDGEYTGTLPISPITEFEIDGKKGLFDIVNNKVVAAPVYNSVEGNRIGFKVGDGEHYGMLDNTGKTIVSMDYDKIDVSYNYKEYDPKKVSIEVYKDNKYGIFDAEGNVQAPLGTKKVKAKDDFDLISFHMTESMA